MILFKKRQSLERRLREFNRSLVVISDADALRASVSQCIEDIFGIENMLFLRWEPDRHHFLCDFARGWPEDLVGDLNFHEDGSLVRLLRINGCPVHLKHDEGAFLSLEESEQQLLAKLKVETVVPLMVLQRLGGLFLLSAATTQSILPSPKKSQHVLQQVTSQAALAFENMELLARQQRRALQLHRAEQLAVVGGLAAGVAHEIRNPLTAIRSTMQYVQGKLEDSGTTELISGLLDEVDRIDHTVARLLNLSQPSHPQIESIDLDRLLEEMLLMVRSQAAQNDVRLEHTYSPGATVQADKREMKQLLLNLLLNALQAQPDGGQIHVSSKPWQPVLYRTAPRWIQIQITDAGPGIPEEALERIFKPFHTTKPTGTGLGLTVCHGIVARHGGEIELLNQPQGGTAAVVRLPSAPPEEATHA